MVFQAWKHEREKRKLISSIRERTAPVIHLTHNDLDAVGADAIHRIKYPDVFTIFSSVGKYPYYLDMIAQVPGNGDIISMSDLSYRPGAEHAIRRAIENGWKIEWRDHHRWHEEDIRTIKRRIDQLHIDTGTCGCGICAEDLLPGDVVGQEIARVVCDYDLWRHEDPRSHVLGLVLQDKMNREHVRDCLVMGVFLDKKIQDQYTNIKKKMDRVLKKTGKCASVYHLNRHVAVAPMFGYPSETAAYLRETLGSDVEILVSSTGKFSIRSRDPISHLVAREYSGGGHPHAAGGQFSWNRLDRFSLLIRKKNRFFPEIAQRAGSIRDTKKR